MLLLLALLALASAGQIAALPLGRAQSLEIGRKVWQNECNGSVAGLTSWNSGENFASLGIGHFIWYPQDARGPFEESFPPLVNFISARGAKLPEFLLAGRQLGCPWRSRIEFSRAKASPQMRQLRQFLADTVDLQAEFLVERLSNSLPKMLAAAQPADQALIQQRFNRLLLSAAGCYALVDYVNFKGEGVLATERYRGQGWGLLQVLSTMQDSGGDSVGEFARAAKVVLARRVANSPAERHEKRWLPGWLNRIDTYTRH
ncbi:MAG TPA: hypothetical protein VGQ82_08690 [Chthoniobacterales bacterium]|nr:hypothetical protein [Chthoniobacterales bacterium]